MSPVSIMVLAIAMSVDAFAASIGKGASAHRLNLGAALKTGAIFGVIEAVMPVIGWTAGVAASPYVTEVDHWIAFALLGAVGSHMIYQAWTRDDGDGAVSSSHWPTILTAVGTSLDAMVVGVSLAFLDVNILIIAIAIGFATMVMSSSGMLAGRFLGKRFGRIAETAGGCGLIGLGSMILFDHLGAM